MAEKLHNIALFGANGQIGTRILQALLDHSKGFTVTAFVQPGARLEQVGERRYVTIKEIDLQKTDRDDLAQVLQGHDAVVSALNGPALATQPLIQDAAADANVQRFYPSEYGMHHLYRRAGDEWAYMHPMWDMKNRANKQCLLHPAILEGKMSYTMIGCGDFYNQEREKVWCPWTQTDVKEYTLHAVISADAKADCTHLDDFAAFLVATLAEPTKSRNAHLNFVSDTVSTSQIATLLSRHSGKKAHVEVLSEEEMQRMRYGAENGSGLADVVVIGCKR